jgi:hypothetical protein
LAVGFSEQRFQSELKGNAYQVWGTTADAAAAEQALLFLQNDDNTGLILVVTYIRLLAINLATTGSFGAGTYFTVGFDQSRTSDGTVVTPVNMNRSSGKTATVTAYSSGDLAGAGTALVLSPAANAAVADRHYPEANLKELRYEKQGSIVLTEGKSITLSLVTDFTTGYAYGRISFVMAKPFEQS